MHILLVHPLIDRLSYVAIFNNIKGVTVDARVNLESLSNKKQKPDLIFFDAELGIDNIDQQICLYQKKNHAIKWLVINITEVQQSLLYLQLGAEGILTLPNKKTLQACLLSLSNGQLYLDADLLQVLALRQINKMLLPFKVLTAREYDVFCMLAEDYSIQTIAELLSVTTKTAFNCQAQIRKKLDVKNNEQIFSLAKKHRLVK